MPRLHNLVIVGAVALAGGCSPSGPVEVAGTVVEAGVPGGAIVPDPALAGTYGYGTTPTAEQIAGWDIDIRPDGAGLPDTEGSVEDGEMLYEDKCASCHGSFGEGVGRYPVLAGGFDTLQESRPEKTVGSYWPYASTVWDYIHRAMPFTEPQSLTDEEVYAITAYVLHLNDIVDYDFVLTKDSLASIEMPNVASFYRDDRPDIQAERCMSDCKDPDIQVTSEPQVGVTPTDGLEGDGAAGAAVAVTAPAGLDVYKQSCALCHDNGVGGAPVLGDANAWSARIARGRDTLNSNAIDGYQGDAGVMPPKGGNLQLSDEDVILAVDYMVEEAGD